MDLLTTILTCSLYASDDALVRAIAEGPSASDPYFVANTAFPATPDAPRVIANTEREAKALAARLDSEGAPLLLGLLEIPIAWLDAFGRPLANAFDPCLNIALGTAMLSAFDAACASTATTTTHGVNWASRLERTNRRVCVLRKYEAALASPDFADTVLFELSAQRARALAVEGAPIFLSPSARAWGPDRLLVVLPLAAMPAAAAPVALP